LIEWFWIDTTLCGVRGNAVATEGPARGDEEYGAASGGAGRTVAADADTADVLVGAESDVRPTLSVVMPTLNEEEGIAECIARVRVALAELGVHGEVVVSDSSTDRTPDIAEAMGAVVVEPDEPGYGYAYQYAFERCRGEYVAMGDADTTYDFEELPKLFAHVRDGDADIAMGSRLDGEIRDGAMPPLHQYVGNPLLTGFLNTFYDTDVSDAHSGMRVFHRDVLDDLDLSTTGMEFASEMIMAAGATDMRIAEEPITYHEREGEATLDSFQDGWRHVRFMLENAPGYLFTAPGLAMLGFGLLVYVTALADVRLGPAAVGPHSLIAASLSLILGFQTLTLGVFAKTAGDPVQAPADPLTGLLTDNLSLEQSVFGGSVLFVGGVGYLALMVGRWVASGFRTLPLLDYNIMAMTGVVLGVLVVFNAFLLSVVADD
jgi:hypothetical protein